MKTKSKKSNIKWIYFFAGGILFLLGTYLILLIISTDKARKLTTEDGPIEDLSAIIWFVAAVIMFFVFFRSKSGKRPYILKLKRNIFYLFLGIFFITCCGEEISWGQRIFKWNTPEIFEKDNAQHEINIHNLWIFQGYDKNQHTKTGFWRWLDSGRIFTLIWVLYCVIIPALKEYSSKVRILIDYLCFPVVPLWIGILFFVNYMISKFFEKMYVFSNSSSVPPIEIKETNCAILFLMASISLFYSCKLFIKKIGTE